MLNLQNLTKLFLVLLLLCNPVFACEDFTTYTFSSEDGTNDSTCTITATKIDCNNFDTRDDPTWMYYDYGAGNLDVIDTDVDVTPIGSNNSNVGEIPIWGNSNDLDCYDCASQLGGVFVGLEHSAGTWYFFIAKGTASFYDLSTSITEGTTYYLTISNDAGASPGQAVIYTDSARTNVHDTINSATGSWGTNHRYNYALTNLGDGGVASRLATFDSENMVLTGNSACAGGGGNDAVTNFSTFGDVNFHGTVSIN